MNNIWEELSYLEWFERFKRIWGELEISEKSLKKTMEMWGIGERRT
jgi:hypothetical protein